MKKIIYIVTKGAYSDYGIHGVFEDKSIADEYAKQISGGADYDKAYVEEYEVMGAADLPIKEGYCQYCVTMQEDGNSTIEKISVRGNLRDHPQTLISKNPNAWELLYSGKYIFYINTDMGIEGATKIANERRIQVMVTGEWPKNGEKPAFKISSL
jgi:hypothetical protein